MKTRNAIIPLITLLGLLQMSHAQDHAGGGGRTIDLPDGSTVIADPFIVEQTQVVQLTPTMKKYFKWAEKIVSTYSAFPSNKSKFLPVLRKFDEIYLVDELPQDPACAHEAATYSDTAELAACTVKTKTYILKNKFSRMNLNNQIGIIIHERLHALLAAQPRPTNLEHIEIENKISQIATGVMFALNKLDAQLKGDRTPLTDAEFTTLNRMIAAFRSLGELYVDIIVHPKGGGVIDAIHASLQSDPNTQIDPTALLGIGSHLSAMGFIQVGKDATLLMARIESTSIFIGTGARIEQSFLKTDTRNGGISIKAGASVTSSSLFMREILIEEKSNINNVLVQKFWGSFEDLGGTFYVGHDSVVDGFSATLRSVPIWNSTRLYHYNLMIGTESTLKGIYFPQSILFPNFKYAQKSSYLSISFEDSLVIDRSSNPFHRCRGDGKKLEPRVRVGIISAPYIESIFCN